MFTYSTLVGGSKSVRFKHPAALSLKKIVYVLISMLVRVEKTHPKPLFPIFATRTFDGKLIIANGTLTSNRQPSDGRYNETIFPAPIPVAYNIIVLQTNEFSVEYDCVVEFGFANYCVHILSRRPTLNETIVENLLKLAEQYDLNPEKLKFTRTNQTNCIYT